LLLSLKKWIKKKIVFLVQIWLIFAKTFAKLLIPRNWKKEKKRKAWPSCGLILMPYQSRFFVASESF